MKALIRSSKDDSEIMVQEIPIPEVKPGHMLVKVEASPIHPADQLHLVGKVFPAEVVPPPVTVGIEAAGTVVKVGEGVDEKEWVGKRMVFLLIPVFPGLKENLGWQQYIHISKDYDFKVELSPKLSFKEGCLLICNPLTAVGMVDIAEVEGLKAIGQNAAASTLGQMLVKYAAKRGIETINIVRRAEQVELLKSIGAKIIINTAAPEWEQQLKEVSAKLGPTAFYDAVGGEMTGKTFDCLSSGSILMNYGNLSEQPTTKLNVDDFMKLNKQMRGYNVIGWRMKKSSEQMAEYYGMLNKDLEEGGKIFGSAVSKTFKLQEWKEASVYAKEHALEGKVVFTPNS